MKKEIYLFDFDGTLVDSMPTFVSVMLRILDENNIKYDDDIIKIITPLGYQGTAEYYRTLGISAPTNELVNLMHEYAKEAYAYKIDAKDGVVSTLKELKRRGAGLNILTASPHTMLDPCLIRLGIWDLFDNVWSCEDFMTTKSNPEIYKMAAERIGAPVEEIIFIDDNLNAVKTAKLAGMKAYGIYDKSSSDYVEDIKKAAHKYIRSLSELLDDGNDTSRMTLNKIKTEDFDFIYSEMEKNFISDERRDYGPAKNLLDCDAYSIYHITDSGTNIGFVTVWNVSDYAFIEHLVVYEKYRNRGYGSIALSLMKKAFNSIVLESEPPTDDIKARRIAFYERNGFCQNDYPYIQPAYRNGGCGVRLILMSYPDTISDIEKTISELYRQVYKKRREI